MATVNQLYQLLNTVQAMAYGTSAVDVVDTSTLVALGTYVMDSSSDKDLFVNTLFDRIGMTLVDNRLYKAADANIIKRDFDFGVAMQKIHVDPVPAEENPEWLIGGDNFTPEYAPVIKPVVMQKIFHDMVTYECGVTVPDNMLKTAFVNEIAFGAFLIAIMNALENGIELVKERAVDLTRATMIAYALKNGQGVNLLTVYNAGVAQADQIEAAQYLKTPEAMSDGCMQMSLTADRMERMNKVFNADGYARFTPKDLLKVDVLNVFDYAVKYGLRPVVYNEKFIQLPGYRLVPYWIGSDQDYNFEGISTVDISKPDGQGGSETVADQSGVLAVMYDIEAAGVNIFGERSAFDRNERAAYTTHYRQMTAQYYVDSSEQCVVFYIADAEPGPEPGPTSEVDSITRASDAKKLLKSNKTK